MAMEKHTKAQKIFLFGAGQHAHTCVDVLEKQGTFMLVGYIDSVKDIGSKTGGYPVLGRLEDLKTLAAEYETSAGFIAIGDNFSMKKVHEKILKQLPDFEFVNLIHPSALFGQEVLLGKGVLIGAQSFISSHTKLGDFCLVHQQTQLGLNNIFEEYASISLGSITGGKVKVGTCSAITLGVIVQDRLNIGPHTVVGSGSLVLHDLPDHVVAYGSPARIVRKRVDGEPYLKTN
jgi:sugar O-acyltransferase (sialic acid O-acetyltransferase NeuD family)